MAQKIKNRCKTTKLLPMLVWQSLMLERRENLFCIKIITKIPLPWTFGMCIAISCIFENPVVCVCSAGGATSWDIFSLTEKRSHFRRAKLTQRLNTGTFFFCFFGSNLFLRRFSPSKMLISEKKKSLVGSAGVERESVRKDIVFG